MTFDFDVWKVRCFDFEVGGDHYVKEAHSAHFEVNGCEHEVYEDDPASHELPRLIFAYMSLQYVEDVHAVDINIAIGEHAFRTGYDLAAQRAVDFAPTIVRDWAAHREAAWSDYTPPEELCGGGSV